MKELEILKKIRVQEGICNSINCEECRDIFNNGHPFSCTVESMKVRAEALLKEKYNLEYVDNEFKEIKKELTDIEKLEYLIKEGGSCHAEKLWQCEYCPVNELYTGFGGDGCRSDTALPLAKQKLSELKGEKKPKFKKGQKVRCTEHGTEFEIGIIAEAGHWPEQKERLYFGIVRRGEDTTCNGKHKNGKKWYGVPESQLELVEEEVEVEIPEIAKFESDKYICENADECKNHYTRHCIPHKHRDTCPNICGNFKKPSKCIPVSEYERRKRFEGLKMASGGYIHPNGDVIRMLTNFNLNKEDDMISICDYIKQIALAKYPKWNQKKKRVKLEEDLMEHQGLINQMLREKEIESKMDEIMECLDLAKEKEDV